MLGGYNWPYGHDAELLNHHIGRLLMPVPRLGWETAEVDKHVQRSVPVGSGCLLYGSFIEVVKLEDLGTCFLELGGRSVVHKCGKFSTGDAGLDV